MYQCHLLKQAVTDMLLTGKAFGYRVINLTKITDQAHWGVSNQGDIKIKIPGDIPREKRWWILISEGGYRPKFHRRYPPSSQQV